jgi:acyl-coenzyme A thioesterase PaaI-like protein
MRAVGRVIHLGRQTAMAEASLIDAAGKLHAQSNTTCLIFDIPGKLV